jgi:hypothetical protein
MKLVSMIKAGMALLGNAQVLTEYEYLFELCESGGTNSVRILSNAPQPCKPTKINAKIL